MTGERGPDSAALACLDELRQGKRPEHQQLAWRLRRALDALALMPWSRLCDPALFTAILNSRLLEQSPGKDRWHELLGGLARRALLRRGAEGMPEILPIVAAAPCCTEAAEHAKFLESLHALVARHPPRPGTAAPYAVALEERIGAATGVNALFAGAVQGALRRYQACQKLHDATWMTVVPLNRENRLATPLRLVLSKTNRRPFEDQAELALCRDRAKRLYERWGHARGKPADLQLEEFRLAFDSIDDGDSGLLAQLVLYTFEQLPGAVCWMGVVDLDEGLPRLRCVNDLREKLIALREAGGFELVFVVHGQTLDGVELVDGTSLPEFGVLVRVLDTLNPDVALDSIETELELARWKLPVERLGRARAAAILVTIIACVIWLLYPSRGASPLNVAHGPAPAASPPVPPAPKVEASASSARSPALPASWLVWSALKDQAERASSDGDVDEAISLYERALEQARRLGPADPRTTDMLGLLASCLSDNNEHERAMQLGMERAEILLQQVSARASVGSGPNLALLDQFADALQHLGEEAETLHKPEEAARSFNLILKTFEAVNMPGAPRVAFALMGLSRCKLATSTPEAIALAERALGIAENHLDLDAESRADMFVNVARLYERKGDSDRAGKLYQKALTSYYDHAGDATERDEAARIFTEVALFHHAHNELEEALPLLESARQIYEGPGVSASKKLARTLHNIGACQAQLGLYAPAEASFQRALSIRRGMPADRGAIVSSLSDLIQLAHLRGAAVGALPLIEEGAQLLDGDGNLTDVALVDRVRELARGYVAAGRADDASRLCTRFRLRLKAGLALDRLTRFAADLALAHRRFAEAAQLLERLLLRPTAGPAPAAIVPLTQDLIRRRLAAVYRELGRFADASRLELEAPAAGARPHGASMAPADASWFFDSLTEGPLAHGSESGTDAEMTRSDEIRHVAPERLADSLTDEADHAFLHRDHATAIAKLTQLAELSRKLWGPVSRQTFGVQGRLAQAYDMAGDPERASALRAATASSRRAFLTAALERARRRSGEDPAASLIQVEELADLAHAQGDSDLAIQLLREAVRLRELDPATPAPLLARTRFRLAREYEDAGRENEAIAVFRSVLAILEATTAAEPGRADALTRLGWLMLSAGDAAGALDRFASALAVLERIGGLASRLAHGAYLGRGLLRTASGTAGAEEDLKAALSIAIAQFGERSSEAWFSGRGLATLQILRGQLDPAEQTLRVVTKSADGRAPGGFLLGVLHRMRGDRGAAEVLLRDAAVAWMKSPDADIDSLNGLCELVSLNDKPDKVPALETLLRSLVAAADGARPRTLLAVALPRAALLQLLAPILARTADVDAIAAQLRADLKSTASPALALVRATLATVLAHREEMVGRYAEAVLLRREAVSIATSTPPGLLRANLLAGLADALEGAGRSAEALQERNRELAMRDAIGDAASAQAQQCLVSLRDLNRTACTFSRAIELGRRVLAILERRRIEDVALADALGALGEIHVEAGEAAQAIPVLERAADLREKLASPVAVAALQARDWLTSAYVATRRLDDAARTIERALALIKGKGEARDQRLPRWLDRRGDLNLSRNQLPLALADFDAANELRRALPDAQDDLRAGFEWQARTLSGAKQLAEAARRGAAALKIARGRTPPDPVPVVRLLDLMAGLMRERDLFDAAQPFYEESVRLRGTKLDYPDAFWALFWCAWLRCEDGNIASLRQAESYARQALALTVGKPDVPRADLDSVQLVLAKALLCQSRVQEAGTLLDEIEGRRVVAQAPADPWVLLKRSQIEQDSGRLVEAETLARECLRTLSGASARQTDLAYAKANLASTLYERRRMLAEAEYLGRTCVAEYRTAPPEWAGSLAWALTLVARILADTGRVQEADIFHAEALTLRTGRANLRDGLPSCDVTAGMILAARGQFSEAAAAYRKAIAGRRVLLGERQVGEAYTQELLGVVCLKVADKTGATAAFRTALEIRTAVFGAAAPVTRRTRALLASVSR